MEYKLYLITRQAPKYDGQVKESK